MFIGVLEAQLDLPGVHSLKQKRGLIKGLLQRIHKKHHAAVAEVAHQDQWQSAGVGCALVGNEPAALQRRLQKILDSIEDDSAGVVLVDYQTDIIE
uniref:DUF503 domain-containing protein n=1 Tax=Magnetococcus massalia (strain MO-1) TaxID=451514 RepID=A0A1S7LNM2_MAGMO|nr:conserved protein of unknown function [Candidatus Magnetococcus massalia]